MKFHAALAVVILATACTPTEAPIEYWKRYDETATLAANAVHENVRMRYQLIQSKLQDKNELWAPFEAELNAFGADRYAELAPLILEQDIPTLQGHVAAGRMTYEDLTTFYLYRIRQLESDSSTTLHAVVALNPDAIEEARKCDRQREEAAHPVYGMPILLKDNINTTNMPTTADGVDVFLKSEILYGPGKAANAGGVAVSGLEMSQNAIRLSWTREEVDNRLRDIMLNIHNACVKYGAADDEFVDYVRGANVAGFIKVADSMLDQGVM